MKKKLNIKKKVTYLEDGGYANENLVPDWLIKAYRENVNPQMQELSQAPIQQIPIDQPQATQLSQSSLSAQNQAKSPSPVGGYIQQGATALGNVLDTVGGIAKGIVTAAPGIINTLLGPEDTKQRKFQIQSANNNPFGDGTAAYYKYGGQIPSMPDGGKITVSDKNDPRYKAYLDSVAAHNLSVNLVNEIRSYNPDHPEYVRYGPKSSFSKELTPSEAQNEMYRMSRNGVPDDQAYATPFSTRGKYKNWVAPKSVGIKVPGEVSQDKNGRLYPMIDYYDAPLQKVIYQPSINSNITNKVVQPNYPPREQPFSPLQSLNSLTFGQTSNPQGNQIRWDNEVNKGIFPIYGQDNMLQGSWDKGSNGDTYFYPTNSSDTSIPKGLPSNTIIRDPSTKSIKNVRFMKKGGITNSIDSDIPNVQSNQGYNISDFKVDPNIANVVVEGGEFAQFPDGSTLSITGDAHSDSSGGEYLNVPDQTRIYSDKIRVDKDVASEILNSKIKRKMTVSDIAKKFNTSKDDEILNNKHSTDLAKRTASINKEIKTNKLNQIFEYQEITKVPKNTSQIPIAEDGIQVGSNKDMVPPGYVPYVDTGRLLDNGQYLNAQPSDYNYLNPRYMHIYPDPNLDIQYNNSNQITPLDIRTNPYVNVDNNSPIGQPISMPSSIRPNLGDPNTPNTITPLVSIKDSTSGALKRFNSGNGLGLGDYIPELFGLSQALSPFPIHTSKFQPVYNTPTEINIQDSLNRNYAQAAPLLNSTGNPSIANARAQQAAANLYDTNNQMYAQKYNIDNQNRQQVSIQNNQLENNANMTNLQRIDQFWDKMTARKANQEKDLQGIVNSAYGKYKGKQLENRQLDLVNQMFPNFKYNTNQGEQFVPMTGPDGKIFNVPITSLQPANSNVQVGDGVVTTNKRKYNSKTGKWEVTTTNTERSGS